MLTPQVIMGQLVKSGQALQKYNHELKGLAHQKSVTEKEYRVALAQKILLLKTDGYPATLIQDLSRGDTQVAELKLERDIAESMYDVCMQKIKDVRAEIEIMRSLLAWEKEELKNSNIE